MKIFEMKLDKKSQGVFAMSIVDNGAMQETFVTLAEEDKKEEVALNLHSDEEKKIITSAAMVPDRLIYRSSKSLGGEEGYIYFSEETIEECAQKFLIEGYKDDATLDHEIPTDNLRTVESWIVEDPDNDKSKALGFDVPKGTWMLSQKVVSDELWDEIKDGEYNGFSIEGNFGRELVNLHKEQDDIEFIDNLLNSI